MLKKDDAGSLRLSLNKHCYKDRYDLESTSGRRNTEEGTEDGADCGLCGPMT